MHGTGMLDLHPRSARSSGACFQVCLGLGFVLAVLASGLGGCTYRLPELPSTDAAVDGNTLPSSCPTVTAIDSPSCPAGTGHCERVRIALPSEAWTVGPNSKDGADDTTTFFQATGGRTIELDVFEVDVARYRRFVRSADLARTRSVTYPDGSVLEGAGAVPGAELPAEAPLCTYGEDATLDAMPVNCVSWSAALAFCAFDGGRLPTLAELEYVRRWWPAEGLEAPGVDGRRYPWGDEEPSARFGTPLPPRFPGGTSSAEPLDREEGPRIGCLYGIAGGVAEWLADDAAGTLDDPCYADGLCADGGDLRIVVTGGWNDLDPEWMRSSAFAGRHHDTRVPGQGFRCVYDVGS
ncbi:MAG: formylglycine-generating enzyme family protein [Sandaracinaceae bacterium]|nr:formylglycine-generating enzyme family protein [Sandaracinaceae bacterium]